MLNTKSTVVLRHGQLLSLLASTLLAGCVDDDSTLEPSPTEPQPYALKAELPDQYTWLVEHGASLTCSEAQLVARGGVLWQKVYAIQDRYPDDPGFITKTTLIRVLNEKTLARYKAEISALPLEKQSDPVALAEIRARVGVQSSLQPADNKYDLMHAGLDPTRFKLVPTRVAAPIDGCDLPQELAPALYAVTACPNDDTEPTPPTEPPTEPPTTPPGPPTPTPGESSSAPSGDMNYIPVANGIAAMGGGGECGSTCKVTCDLAVTVGKQGDAEVSTSKSVTVSPSDGTWKSDSGNAVDTLTNRWRRYDNVAVCRSEGCAQGETWSATMTPGSFGDGSLAVNIHAKTKNPDLDTFSSGCSVRANALVATSLTMDKNAADCNAANKSPVTFDHKQEILYAVHSEGSKESSSETTGSVGVDYAANTTQGSAANANLKASGAGKAGLKVDGVDVTGGANFANQTTWNGKAAFSHNYRRSDKESSTWKAGDTTLDVQNQIQGPPSLTLTNACPQKAVAYKYDITNFRAEMEWETNYTNLFDDEVLCDSRIEAKIPELPAELPFTCTYTTSTDGNAKNCAGNGGKGTKN